MPRCRSPTPSKKVWGWGVTINKSGDGHGVIMAAIQTFGGRIVDETGQKVTFNSPETVAAVKWLAETYTAEKYKPMLPPGIESWTDPSNNEAFLAGKIALTSNAFSVYATAKSENNPIFPNTAVLHFPIANDGTVLGGGGSGWFTIFTARPRTSTLAKEHDRAHAATRKTSSRWCRKAAACSCRPTRICGPTRCWRSTRTSRRSGDHLRPRRRTPASRLPGRSQPGDSAADASGAIQSQMMANVTSGRMTAEEAVTDAHDQDRGDLRRARPAAELTAQIASAVRAGDVCIARSLESLWREHYGKTSLRQRTVAPGACPHRGPAGAVVDDFLGRDWKVALPFVLPMVVFMAGLIFWPFINAMLISFTTRSIRRTETIRRPGQLHAPVEPTRIPLAVANTILFTGRLGQLQAGGRHVIALLLNSRLPFRNVLTGIMLLPWIVPEVVTAMAWRSIYDPIFGGLNPILQALGLIERRRRLAGRAELAMPSVIAVNIWKGIPFFTMLLLAGLKAIDRELYEAAEVDGADAVRPLPPYHAARPASYVIVVAVLLSTIIDFQYLRPGLPDDRRRPRRRDAAVLDSGLREGDRAAALRPWRGDGPQHGAGAGAVHLCSGALYAPGSGRSQQRNMPSTARSAAFGRGLGLADRRRAVVAAFDDLRGAVVGVPYAAAAARAGDPASGARSRCFRSAQRERWGVVLRMLLMLPLLLFVLFPFYWIIITAFKTDCRSSSSPRSTGPNPGRSSSSARC